jgi:DNA-binding response OmpR family regulator
MPALNILLIEDSADDAELLAIELAEAGIDAAWVRVDRESTLRAALGRGGHDLVVSDLGLPGFDGVEALRLVRAALPGVPFVFCSGAPAESAAAEAALAAGADAYVCKDELAKMPQAVRDSLAASAGPCPA